jgi:hypothetical protein
MPFSPTTSMSLRSGLIAVPRGRGACCSTGSSSRLCLWSRYRTRSSSAAGILMKTTGREYESEMDTPPSSDQLIAMQSRLAISIAQCLGSFCLCAGSAAFMVVPSVA